MSAPEAARARVAAARAGSQARVQAATAERERRREPGDTRAYGAGATSAGLDAAGAAFSALLPTLVRLAEEEEAVRNLQAGLLKTVRRLKALERVVIPRLEREVREVAAALEEEERDESVRRKAWLATTRAERRR